jgi:polyhydroxyalkanoate synthesis regulator phasin
MQCVIKDLYIGSQAGQGGGIVAKVEVKVEEGGTEEEAERNPLFGMTRKILLASMGAVALAQEEMESFVEKLVERGELAEQEGRDLLHDVMERRRKEVRRAEVELETQVEEALDRLNVPTKSDIEMLSAKIAALSRKIDELKQE